MKTKQEKKVEFQEDTIEAFMRTFLRIIQNNIKNELKNYTKHVITPITDELDELDARIRSLETTKEG